MCPTPGQLQRFTPLNHLFEHFAHRVPSTAATYAQGLSGDLSMISFMGKLWKSKRGNTLAIAAACFPLFLGAAGLATDTIQWTLWKRQLQRAADSAAIAGAYNREANSGGAKWNSSWKSPSNCRRKFFRKAPSV